MQYPGLEDRKVLRSSISENHSNVYINLKLLIKCFWALTGVALWVGHCLANRKVASYILILGRGVLVTD